MTLPLLVDTEVGTLKSGDYSIRGFEERVAIERKSKEDLFSTLTTGRERFVREMQRLAEMDIAWIIIEGGWRSLIEKEDIRSQANPLAIYHTVCSWQTRYPTVHWWACDTRRFAEKTTYYLLKHWYDLKRPDGLLEKEASGKRRSLHVGT